MLCDRGEEWCGAAPWAQPPPQWSRTAGVVGHHQQRNRQGKGCCRASNKLTGATTARARPPAASSTERGRNTLRGTSRTAPGPPGDTDITVRRLRRRLATAHKSGA